MHQGSISPEGPTLAATPRTSTPTWRSYTCGGRLEARPAELRHAELDLSCPGDELSGVVAAAVGLPARRSLVALGPDGSDASSSSGALSVSSTAFLTRFYTSLHSGYSWTDVMFADTTRTSSSMICCLAVGNHMAGRGPCSAMRLSICESNMCHHATSTFSKQL